MNRFTRRAKDLYGAAMLHRYAPEGQPTWDELTWEQRLWWEYISAHQMRYPR